MYEGNWLGFENYKQSLVDYYLYESCTPDYNDFKVLDRVWSKYEIYNVLTKDEVWEQIDYINLCELYESGFIDTSWEDEYEAYIKECDRLHDKLFSKDYHLPWFDTEKVIKTKHKIYNRKKKHIKDAKPIKEWGNSCTRYLNLIDRHIVSENKTHKHKRAEKQYDDYFTAEAEECVAFDWDDDYLLPCDLFSTEYEYLDEIGCPQYSYEFDWKRELEDSDYYDNEVIYFPFVNKIKVNG